MSKADKIKQRIDRDKLEKRNKLTEGSTKTNVKVSKEVKPNKNTITFLLVMLSILAILVALQQ